MVTLQNIVYILKKCLAKSCSLNNQNICLVLRAIVMFDYLFLMSEEHHISQENWEQQLMLAVMKGNAGEHLKTAATAGKLTDWHMATATMGEDFIQRKIINYTSHCLRYFLARLLILIKKGGLLQLKFGVVGVGVNIYLRAR